jgi:hypothetical protein
VTTTLLAELTSGRLRLALSNGPTVYVPLTPHLRIEIDPDSETLCSLEYRTIDLVLNTSILSVIRHRQNHSQST